MVKISEQLRQNDACLGVDSCRWRRVRPALTQTGGQTDWQPQSIHRQRRPCIICAVVCLSHDQLRPSSTISTSLRQAWDISSWTRTCRFTNSIATTSPRQTQNKFTTNSKRRLQVCAKTQDVVPSLSETSSWQPCFCLFFLVFPCFSLFFPAM